MIYVREAHLPQGPIFNFKIKQLSVALMDELRPRDHPVDELKTFKWCGRSRAQPHTALKFGLGGSVDRKQACSVQRFVGYGIETGVTG